MNRCLGAALYYNADLSIDPGPLRALWGAITRDVEPARLVQWTGTLERVGKKQRFDLEKLAAAVRAGDAASAAVESDDGLLVLTHATPLAKLRAPLVSRPWRYDTVVAIPAAQVEVLGRQQAVDAIVAFAASIEATAGVVFWTDSVAYAAGLATGGVAGRLAAEQVQRVRDSHDLSNHWGRIVRGPHWGTLLNAAQVATLGDVAALPAAAMVPLPGGGAFVQLTAADAAPLVDDADPAMSALRAAMAPVSG